MQLVFSSYSMTFACNGSSAPWTCDDTTLAEMSRSTSGVAVRWFASDTITLV